MERELDPREKRLPIEPAPTEAPRADVKVASSLVRCPYCHADVASDAAGWVACEKCLARHHTACWDEGGRCSTCGGTARLRADKPASRGAKLAAFLIAAIVALLVLFAVIVPMRASSLTERAAARRTEKANARERAAAVLTRASLKLANDDPDDAIRNATEAIELDPSFALAWHERARARLRKGDDKGALDDMNRAFTADPDAPAAPSMYGVRGEARRRTGDLGGALEDGKKAVELDPKDHVLWRHLGTTHLQNSEYEAAVRALTKAIELDEKDAFAYYGRALALEKAGRPGAARSDWACVLELVPPSSSLADEAHAGLDRTKK